MQDSSLGIIAALEATGEVTLAVNSTFPGWGLTTLHTWPSWVSQNLAHYHPQIAIGSWSWDDPEALSDPVAYRALLESFVRAMLAPTAAPASTSSCSSSSPRPARTPASAIRRCASRPGSNRPAPKMPGTPSPARWWPTFRATPST